MKRIVVCSAVLGEVEAMQKIIIILLLLFTKQRKFHQVKVTSPFLLNKIMATSTTKQSRKARFTTNYRTAEKDSFYINYKTAEEASFYNQLQNSRGRLVAKLANKREKAGGDCGFTVSLQQPPSPCAWRKQ